MAKQYQVNRRIRLINRMMKGMIHWRIAPKHTNLMAVDGRKTGNPYSTPVNLVERDRQRGLVSLYGEVNLLNNVRTAGEISLCMGGKTDTFKIQEQDSKESAPILKEYINLEGIVRPYFDVILDSPIEDCESEASKHPVFLLVAE